MSTEDALFDALHAEQASTFAEGRPALDPLGRFGVVLVVLGVGALALCLLRPGLAGSLGWAGLAAIGSSLLGGTWAWNASVYGRTPPGIRNDGVFFRRVTRPGWLTGLLTLLFCGLYVVLWWSSYAGGMVLLAAATAAIGLWSYGERATVRYAGTVVLALLAAWVWFADLTPSALDALDPLAGGIALVDPLARALRDAPADKWFFYTVAYTTAVTLMGIRMGWRYRHNRYHLLRTASVVFWQGSFGFVVPMLLAHAGQKEQYLSYFWPLKPEYLLPFQTSGYWDGGTVSRAMVLWGLLMSFVAVPVLTWRYGKRWYCSWVCGCGALAETVGDPWRQLSDKGVTAWRVERVSIHAVLVLITGITVFLWTHEALGRPWLSDGGSELFWRWYGFYIVAGFAGVVGTGFYPLLGGRIWCRFGCPQAAILGLIQRFYSRFRITTNGGQCISCGNCSTYCEMGIDVRAYAQRGDAIVRASCVGCGVCAAVCPRGVLKLENGPHDDRFEGADEPIQEFLRSLGVKPRT